MKGQLVGNEAALLWPNADAMSRLLSIARPRNHILATEAETPELLWPARLINQQARLSQRKDYSRPVAMTAFIASIILAIVIGPTQLILIATMLDYNWVTSTYFPRTLNYVLIFSVLVAVADLIALILAWNSQPRRTYQTVVLTIGSLALLTTIWLAGDIISLQPHQLTLTLLAITLVFIMAYLLISKQYFTATRTGTVTKIFLSLLMISAIAVIGLDLTDLIQSHTETNPQRIAEMTIEMQNAHLEVVPENLSNLTYLLCAGKYQLIYLSDERTSGLFECSDSGDVYSVQDPKRRNANSIRGEATYLGTTRNKEISLSFPTARFLYRSLPGILEEDELALMYPATSENELLDNITPQLLNYWNSHNNRGLFVNIFYNASFNEITSTKDFILMAAMDTMSLVDQLPNGNTRYGPADGRMFSYIYETDRSLTALSELAANPKNYANSTRDSLTTYRHISLHLQPGETYTLDTLRDRLGSSFVAPEI